MRSLVESLNKSFINESKTYQIRNPFYVWVEANGSWDYIKQTKAKITDYGDFADCSIKGENAADCQDFVGGSIIDNVFYINDEDGRFDTYAKIFIGDDLDDIKEVILQVTGKKL